MMLYPRRGGGSRDLETRTRATAHRLLDRYRAGDDVPKERVEWALRMTGDLTADSRAKGAKQ